MLCERELDMYVLKCIQKLSPFIFTKKLVLAHLAHFKFTHINYIKKWSFKKVTFQQTKASVLTKPVPLDGLDGLAIFLFLSVYLVCEAEIK